MSNLPSNYIDSRYKKLMETPARGKEVGQKLVEILVLLAEGVMAVKEIHECITPWTSKDRDKKQSDTKDDKPSISEIQKLLLWGEKTGYLAKIKVRHLRRSRGGHLPKIKGGPFERQTGRPADNYCLTEEGLWLIRYDPRIRNRWTEVVKTYVGADYIPEYFESYANLRQAIEVHPILSKYHKPYYFMEGEMIPLLLNPFVWVSERKAVDAIKHYDQLVKLIKVHVKPKTIVSCYETLEGSISQLNMIIHHYALLTEKMQALPEVQEYLNKKQA